MAPDRKCKIGGKLVEEFYWCSKTVVYVDDHLVDRAYDDICRELKNNQETS
jgi:hypothetical protein